MTIGFEDDTEASHSTKSDRIPPPAEKIYSPRRPCNMELFLYDSN
jgi:hypothetical protein